MATVPVNIQIPEETLRKLVREVVTESIIPDTITVIYKGEYYQLIDNEGARGLVNALVRDQYVARQDPTHGRIDSDIQQSVDEMNPRDIGQRAAIENTLQEQRDYRGRP